MSSRMFWIMLRPFDYSHDIVTVLAVIAFHCYASFFNFLLSATYSDKIFVTKLFKVLFWTPATICKSSTKSAFNLKLLVIEAILLPYGKIVLHCVLKCYVTR